MQRDTILHADRVCIFVLFFYQPVMLETNISLEPQPGYGYITNTGNNIICSAFTIGRKKNSFHPICVSAADFVGCRITVVPT